MKIGMIFPGQGSQFLGMGKDFYDNERLVQELFEEASSCLDQNFVRLCFASSEKELCQTANAQLAIFVLSAAIFKLLKEKYEVVPHLVAGHSSGEYAAIHAAGGLSFPDTLYLLKKRAIFMEEATRLHNGSMLAVLGLEKEKLEEICNRYDDQVSLENVAQIVNFNTPTQLVVSGTLPELEKIKSEIQALRIKAMPLNVSGAFHSRLMQEPEKNFCSYMIKVDFKDLSIPLVNNIEAKKVVSADIVKNSLVTQMSSPVLWWQSMQHFKDFDVILQLGPSDKLAKMLKREWPEKQIFSVNTPADLQSFFTAIGVKMKIEPDLDLNSSEKIVTNI